MTKLIISDLAARLMEKHGLDKREASYFIDGFIETIQKGLRADNQVKIKGLGTFKIVGVGARESVNVNTGERVTINSHSKLSFVPDPSMKELVNKPFSQFETVVLNDGVEFDDMPHVEESVDIETADEAEVETAEVETAEVELQALAVEEEPVPAEKLVAEEEPVTEVEPVAEVEPVDADQPAEAAFLQSEPVKQPFPWLWILVAAIAGFLLGYLFAKGTASTVEEMQPVEQVVDTTAVAEQPADTIAAAIAAEPEEIAEEPTTEVVEEEPPAEEIAEVAAAPAFDSQKYEDMDARVRLGAYRIIGVQETVKARSGETLKQISRRYLGPDMECYVEALNGLKAKDPLKAGQKIKIPKLEWKKKK